MFGHCGGLNKIGSHRLIDVNGWPLGCGAIWQGIGDVALEWVSPCWRCVTEDGSDVLNVQPGPETPSLFLLPADPDIEPSVTSPIPRLPVFPMLLAMLIVKQTSEQ